MAPAVASVIFFGLLLPHMCTSYQTSHRLTVQGLGDSFSGHPTRSHDPRRRRRHHARPSLPVQIKYSEIDVDEMCIYNVRFTNSSKTFVGPSNGNKLPLIHSSKTRVRSPGQPGLQRHRRVRHTGPAAADGLRHRAVRQRHLGAPVQAMPWR